MTGAIIQLVAYGYEDLFITKNPQITYFKVVYRRYTNFAHEQIRQEFIDDNLDFGKSITATISKNGDLMGNVYAVITLPPFNQIDNYTKFAWVRRIGFAVISHVEIQLNGVLIDRHYSEWLNLWSELSGYIKGEKSHGFNRMIGNIPELYDFSFSKNSYELYVPLQFWFCKSPGSYIPLTALEYTDVKINVQLNDVENCYLITPSHYINSELNVVNFIPGEYIQQGSGSNMAAGIFSYFDPVTSRIYYYKITNKKLIGIPAPQISLPTTVPPILDPTYQTAVEAQFNDPNNQQYLIIGNTSKFECFAPVNAMTYSYGFNSIRNLSLLSCYLLVDYYYLDDEERYRFMNSKHDYLIEQVYFTPNYSISGGKVSVKVNAQQPCKLLLWVTQFDYIYKSGDYFNYTDFYIRRNNNLINYYQIDYNPPSLQYLIGTTNKNNIYDPLDDDPIGNNISIKQSLSLNGKQTVTTRTSDYFDKIQPYQYLDYQMSKGSNMVSFSLYPMLSQPSGTCNLSQIELVDIGLQVSSLVTPTNTVKCRSYALCNNVLRIVYGFAAPVFIH